MLTSHLPIIVAVDASGSADAVEWAAAESAAQDAPLRLVHAIAPLLAVDPYGTSAMLECAASRRAAVARLLDDAATRAAAVAPGIEVGTRVLDGTLTWALRKHAEAALLLVVGGHEGHGGLRGLLARSVPGELAGHSPCPVVVVPPLDGPIVTRARVVVGIDRGRSNSGAIGFGFHAARQRGIPLTLVHVCAPRSAPSAPDAVVNQATFVGVLGERMVAETIDRWRDELPTVRVDFRLCFGDPPAVLIAESCGAAMIVVGAPGHGRRLGKLLGSTGQAVLENAACPIAIVPQDRAIAVPAGAPQRAQVPGTERS